MDKKILIIVPSFNEEQSLKTLLPKLKSKAGGFDVVVVDDGSKDETREVALKENVKVVSHPYNMGIGATMQTGYKYALKHNYDIALQCDGDGQHLVEEIDKIVEPLLEGIASVVVGSRFLGVGDYKPSFARHTGIKIFSKVVSFIIGEHVTDTTSGFRAVKKEVIEYFAKNYPEDYPEVEALVLLHKKGFTIKEVPVKMVERQGGVSSITPIRSVYYMVKVMLAIFVDLLKKA